MKIFITAAIMGLIPLLSYHNISFADDKKVETKKVCVDKRDAKGDVIKKPDGKPVQECKEMKVHKKLEGTEVPPKK
jgi:hypothetical protein